MPEYRQYKQIFQGQPMPFAYLDLDLLNQNIQQILLRAGDKKIRIASKSVRSLPILKHILASNPKFQRVMCFSPAEAVWLSQQGLDDLLLGYPVWQSEQLRAICSEIKEGKTIVAMLDSLEHVRHLDKIAGECGVILPVCLDLDLSTDFPMLHFGVWRSSTTNPQAALRIYEQVKNSRNLRLDGLMGYEAQIAGVGDQIPAQRLKNNLINYLKTRSIAQLRERRAETVKLLEANGAQLRFVNGGGTGSLESTREEVCVSEVTVGSGFYSPTLFDHYRQFQHQPAAGFALEIVRRPTPSIYTCSGGGYIASGAAGPEKLPQPYLPVGAKLIPLEGAGEVQTPIQYFGSEKLALGDPIFLRHAKAGELCERFNSLLLISQGQIVEEVFTYRGQGLCFF